MPLNNNDISYLKVKNDIEGLYDSLRLSVDEIIRIIRKENDKYYNPKTDTILECDSKKDFIDFQYFLKGLNSFIYHNSLILTSYSIFEYSLKLVCKYIEYNCNNCGDYIDEKNKILENCFKYIKRSNVSFDEIDGIYQRISIVNKLRNLIAHYNGNIRIDKNKTLENQNNYILFISDKRLYIHKDGQVYINDDEYIMSFIRDSFDFLNYIIEKIKTTANT